MTMLDQDILRVSCNFELGGGIQYQNIFHYIRDGDDVIPEGAHVLGLEAAIEAAYAELVAIVEDNVTAQLCFVDRIEFNEIVDEWRVVENIGTFTPSFTPTGIVETLPYQSSAYVVFKTGRPRTVGKKYLFPMLETQQADTILVAGAVTAITAWAAEIMDGVAVQGDVTLTPGVPRTGVASWFNFLVAVVGDVLGSQRRRKPGVGA